MKIWNSYGSEHSANLVMIGEFKDAASAEEAKGVIDQIIKFMNHSSDDHRRADRYSPEALAFLQKIDFFTVAPFELEQFIYDVAIELKDKHLIITTDEVDVSGFLKLMIHKGARIEVYSAHDYPEGKEKPGIKR